MRIFLLIIIFLAFLALCSIAEAQKTCTPIARSTQQTCTVTITVGGAVSPYELQQIDANGKVIKSTTTTSNVIQEVFTDTGNMKHCYDATSKGVTSAVECWVTPAIAIKPPDPPIKPPVTTNYMDITTDRTVKVSRCINYDCDVTLQVQKDTQVKINGVVVGMEVKPTKTIPTAKAKK